MERYFQTYREFNQRFLNEGIFDAFIRRDLPDADKILDEELKKNRKDPEKKILRREIIRLHLKDMNWIQEGKSKIIGKDYETIRKILEESKICHVVDESKFFFTRDLLKRIQKKERIPTRGDIKKLMFGARDLGHKMKSFKNET